MEDIIKILSRKGFKETSPNVYSLSVKTGLQNELIYITVKPHYIYHRSEVTVSFSQISPRLASRSLLDLDNMRTFDDLLSDICRTALMKYHEIIIQRYLFNASL